ncbi:unnamed protein product, partial [Angiostrongylus costaricensis]|uniref:TPR_REGION domain-containing protein n=1 Tax=Angiostrongylus costaricensis TaxID=334426 RepID=A0A0R3PV07_ANGCS
KQACDEYQLALQCGKEYRNADLHLNAGSAFRYQENYSEALSHLKQAVKYDPNNVIGGLRSKRTAEFKASLLNCSSSINPFTGLTTVALFKDLKDGPNTGIVTIGKIVASLSHEDTVPIASVLMDVEGDRLALCIYNSAPSLSFSIGDTIAVADPYVIVVKDLNLPDLPGGPFRSIRVPNPSKISRNGSLPRPTQLAPSHLKISTL